MSVCHLFCCMANTELRQHLGIEDIVYKWYKEIDCDDVDISKKAW